MLFSSLNSFRWISLVFSLITGSVMKWCQVWIYIKVDISFISFSLFLLVLHVFLPELKIEPDTADTSAPQSTFPEAELPGRKDAIKKQERLVRIKALSKVIHKINLYRFGWRDTGFFLLHSWVSSKLEVRPLWVFGCELLYFVTRNCLLEYYLFWMIWSYPVADWGPAISHDFCNAWPTVHFTLWLAFLQHPLLSHTWAVLPDCLWLNLLQEFPLLVVLFSLRVFCLSFEHSTCSLWVQI